VGYPVVVPTALGLSSRQVDSSPEKNIPTIPTKKGHIASPSSLSRWKHKLWAYIGGLSRTNNFKALAVSLKAFNASDRTALSVQPTQPVTPRGLARL
jgi:hypothetical protein